MAASQAVQHATPGRSLNTAAKKPAAVRLGQLTANNYAALPPRMQKACRIMQKNGECTIENFAEGSR